MKAEYIIILLIQDTIRLFIAIIISFVAYRILKLQNSVPFVKVILSLIGLMVLQEFVAFLFAYPARQLIHQYNLSVNLVSVVYILFITKKYLKLSGKKLYIFWVVLAFVSYTFTYYPK